ncbi:MAG: nickel-dependent lactate racemase [Desulfatiglans sp.]|nr:nickel-dependent lactate racemase [Desulfatiglans sp.]
MKDLYIRYGHKKLFFDVPEGFNILDVADFEDNPVLSDTKNLTINALDNPVDALPLEKQLRPSDRIAILIEDNTRNSPKKEILKHLLERLARISIPESNIIIIVALGTHEALTSKEMIMTYGEEVINDYTIINHDPLSPDLMPVGKLVSGTVVRINRLAYEADFRIGIGSIFPHPLNGFGGGGKIMFPGISNFDAILEHHMRYAFRKIVLGGLTPNPFYEEVTALASAGRLDFIINSVLDHNDNLYNVVAGHPVNAHTKGAGICKKLVSKTFKNRADITIISAFPYTQATQLMKPLEPASIITKEQGVIILTGKCTSAFRMGYLDACLAFREKYKGRLKEALFDFFNSGQRIISGGAPELNMSIAQVILALESYRVILFSGEVPQDDAEKLGFISAATIEDAIHKSAQFIPYPTVNVVPSGGVIIPELE